MGSSASVSKTTVQPLETSSSNRNKRNGESESLRRQLSDCEKQLKETEGRCDQLSDEVKRLNNLVTELEGQKLDLEDRLSSLEGQMEYFCEEKANEKYEETMKAKDQIILNLEQQIVANETKARKANASNRRKLRHYATQLAEEKHANAIRVMELRQQVNRLTDENEKLKKRKEDAADAAGDGAHSEAAPRDALVVELSQQLLSQTHEVARLERAVRDRERRLEHLEATPKPGRQWSGYSLDSGLDSDAAPDSAGPTRRSAAATNANGLSPLAEGDSGRAAGEEIAEDCNWDAASLEDESEDTPGASPRLLARHRMPVGPARERTIILDPDQAQTIDNLLELTAAS